MAENDTQKQTQALISIVLFVVIAIVSGIVLLYGPGRFVPATEQEAFLFYVALEDAGEAGLLIGCDDSLVESPVMLSEANQLDEALQLMLDASETPEGTDLYNPLGAHADALFLHDVTISDGVATVSFRGSLADVAHCEIPRFEEQVRQTALQFDGVDSVEILVEGEPFEFLVDESGL